jgi:hypothetical protein
MEKGQERFCFIIGHCRYRESRERAREPDGSVVHDPSVRSDHSKPERKNFQNKGYLCTVFSVCKIMSRTNIEEGEILSAEQEQVLLNDDEEPAKTTVDSTEDRWASMFREFKDDVLERFSRIEAKQERPSKRRRRRKSTSAEESPDDEISDTEKLCGAADFAETSSQREGDTPNGQMISESDDNLLSEIAQEFDGGDDTGPNVSEKLADIVNKRWAEKLDDSKFKSKLEKYNRPANCTRLLVPKVNPEIWANLNHNTKSADLRIVNFQKTLTKAGSALTKMTDSLLELRTKLSKSDTEQQKTLGELVSGNADALALLGHLNIDLSLHRRELIKPHLKREYGALCSTRTPITDFIFGDDLQSQLSSITASNKTGQTTGTFGSGATPRRYSDSHNKSFKGKYFLWQRKGRAYRPA